MILPTRFLNGCARNSPPEDKKKLTRGSTENAEAYQLYLKGNYYTNMFIKDGFSKGLDYFGQAIAIDPNYGLAYTGLAYNYIHQEDWYIRPNEAGSRAREAAKKALAINDSDADAHVALAIATLGSYQSGALCLTVLCEVC